MAKRQLNLMTVFIPRENLFFIEEWLLYHLRLGVDHVYFYNNAGSRWIDQYNNVEVTGRNKHGVPVYQILAHLTGAAVDDRLRRVLAPYIAGGHATLVRWQPRDASGQPTFQQPEAYIDYIIRFAATADWTAFLDLDEFLVTPLYGTMPPLLADLDTDGVQLIRMIQKAFPSRFDARDQPVAEVLAQTRCDPALIDYSGPKTMIRGEVLVVPEQPEGIMVHYPPARDDAVWFSDPAVLRFNHYRYDERIIAHHRAISGRDVTLSQEDDGMLPHLPWIASHRHSVAGRDAGVRSRPRRRRGNR